MRYIRTASVTGVAYSDSATVRMSLTPSGIDVSNFVDQGTALITLQPSGVDAPVFADAANLILSLQPSGNEIYESIDSANFLMTLTVSSIEQFILGVKYRIFLHRPSKRWSMQKYDRWDFSPPYRMHS